MDRTQSQFGPGKILATNEAVGCMAFLVTMKAANHEHQAVPSDLARRVKALESLLVDPAARGDLQAKARV